MKERKTNPEGIDLSESRHILFKLSDIMRLQENEEVNRDELWPPTKQSYCMVIDEGA